MSFLLEKDKEQIRALSAAFGARGAPRSLASGRAALARLGEGMTLSSHFSSLSSSSLAEIRGCKKKSLFPSYTNSKILREGRPVPGIKSCVERLVMAWKKKEEEKTPREIQREEIIQS